MFPFHLSNCHYSEPPNPCLGDNKYSSLSGIFMHLGHHNISLVCLSCVGNGLRPYNIKYLLKTATKLYTKFAQKGLQFNSSNILYNSLNKFIGCATHLIFLHNLHQHQQPCKSQKQQHLSSSCTSLNFVFKNHFVTSSTTLSSLPNFSPWRASLRDQNS